MKLYTYSPAPNPLRVEIFLKEKGESIETIEVDLMSGAQFDADFTAINPLHTVPALQLGDGTVLAQVPAICEYLESVYPAKPLLGTTPRERAEIKEWCHRIFMEGITAIANVFRNRSPAFAGRAVPGPVKCEQIPALIERGTICLDAWYKTMNAHLAGREFVVGDSFTMADIDAVVACNFALWIKQPIPDHCEHLKQWYDFVSTRPSVVSG